MGFVHLIPAFYENTLSLQISAIQNDFRNEKLVRRLDVLHE